MSRSRSKMENPAFLDSDQSVYESARGTPRNMSTRRPHHLPAIHHAHTHGPRGMGVHHGPHVHNGRVLGVTGVPGPVMVGGAVVGVAGVPVSTPSHTTYPDPSLPPMYPTHPAHLGPQAHMPQGEPMYSCQAPRDHDHVYQCPGHRGDHYDHREHHIDPHMDPREHRLDPREHHMDPREHHIDPREHHIDPREHHMDPREHHMDPREHHMDPRDHHMDPRNHHMDPRDQRLDPREHHMGPRELNLDPREHQLDPALDHRPDYHYGGSDYSSTEPIYAQPHLYPREGTGTPTLGYTNTRASLRGGSQASTATPAKYLVRSDSCGNSTSSSTLPTVSALLAREAAHTPAHVPTPSLRSSARHHGKGGVSLTPTAKLKRQGLFRAWRVKFLRGEGGRRRAGLLFAGLLLLLLLVLGGLAAVLYVTLGGGISAFVGTSPKLIEMSETGSSVVEGEFRIMNQNFWQGLEDPTSEEYKSMAQSIESELDTLFLASMWSHEYNHSRIMSLAEGSLLVQAQLVLNTADVAAAKRLSTAFLRGLSSRHGSEWMGQYSVDVNSIRFTEVIVDTPPTTTTQQSTSSTTPRTTAATERVAQPSPPPHLNVGWGQWGPWSTCSPCSPQYDQIRTRQCHIDAGRGVLINSIEPCLPSGLNRQLQGTGGDMETRPCQCQHTEDEETEKTTTTTTTITTTTSTTTTPPPTLPPGLEMVDEEVELLKDEKGDTERLCDACLPGEVCVGLQGEPYPTCRTARDPADRTGCGGLCTIEAEVCQALGSRAFQCHSASLCLHDEWRCADGLCIPHIKRCDGHMNCYDQSDEQHCHRKGECGHDQFQCGNNTSCLPITSKCDGKMDCWDGSDEANCTTSASVSPSSSSVTGWRIAGMGQMNPSVVLDSANPTSISAGTGDASQHSPSVMVGTRVATPVMNRTAIGLSSLSHRERELLS